MIPKLAILLLLIQGLSDGIDQWDSSMESAYRALETEAVSASQRVSSVQERGDGVVYAVGGSSDFVEQEVLPCVRYLRQFSTKGTLRYALMAERKLVAPGNNDENLKELNDFFDIVTVYEDVAKSARQFLDPRVRVKSIKAYAMWLAPFERFVWLDFDSRPCSAHFATKLFAQLEALDVDALLHNQWPAHQSQLPLNQDAHYRIEHNSAIAVFDKRRTGTRAALALFAKAFDTIQPPPKRDQPPLMVALRLAFKYHAFSHFDLPANIFCRKNASDTVSCDADCLIVHKPMKYDPNSIVLGLGARGTGSSAALTRLLASLKLVNKPDCILLHNYTHHALSHIRPMSSKKSLLLPNISPQESRVPCKVYPQATKVQDAVSIAKRFPRAKFILTTVSNAPCPDQIVHTQNMLAAIPRERIFSLDLAHAGEPEWRRFCAFLEIWSSCKFRELAKIARAWHRAQDQKNKNLGSSCPPFSSPGRSSILQRRR